MKGGEHMAKQAKSGFGKTLLWLVICIVVFVIGVYSGVSMEKSAIKNTVATATNQVSNLVSFVDSAAALVGSKQDAAFDDFRTPNSPWWQGDNYIFAYDMQGNTLVLPPTQNLEGTNRWDTADANGVKFVQEMAKQLANNDSAWVMYAYPKPGETVATPKLAYVKKVKLGNQDIFVGSGIYY